MKLNRTALRTIDILEYVSKHKQGCTLQEIMVDMNLPKSSAFDIVKTLVYKAMLVEDVSSGKLRYKTGVHSFILGSSYVENLDVIQMAKSYLESLAEQLGKTTFIATLEEAEVVYLYKCESKKSVITTANIGSRKSIHCTALGKVLLAFEKDEQQVTHVLDQTDFVALTPYTLTSKQAYLEALKKVREQGYALDIREDALHQMCVAAPIFDHQGSIQAAMSCVGLYEEDVDIRSLSNQVREVAMNISKTFGYRGETMI